ncbi:ATP-binding protein [Bradyrhizobium sp. Mp27]|uniref:ATP-binding protein n=1 Tax=Bradyrhizobium sp. Mp27 TaxID=3042157 RepID=UPI00248CB1C8|nr:ATP-binding protein [Bradyrhizobium sp. Mp27]MDI2075542.1 ATP-binding protein [Bradyrhizobium sp. Mp27]
MTDDQPLRILSLDVENILRVVAVRVRPDGKVVELTGRNRQGKSSVIEAIWMALGGERLIPTDPIHDGAEVGRIVLDLGDDAGTQYRVARKIVRADNEKGFATSLTIEGADGKRFTNPQKILNGFIGALSCDPLDFIAMKPQEQFDLLKQFVAGVDFDKIAKANDDDFKTRTDVNRDAKAKRVQADGIRIDPDAPTERQDEGKLVAELAAAGEANAAAERFRSGLAAKKVRAEAADAAAEANRKRIEELRKEIATLEVLADQTDAEAADLRLEIAEAGDCPVPVDTADLTARINAARDANARFDVAERARADRTRLDSEAATLEKRADELTKVMADRTAAKEKAVAEAKMPVAGISFGDGAILLDGHPLAQASQAQKLNLAIAIGVALQPRLRFITTKNAALLDKDSWKALVDLAEQQNLMIIAETVQSDRPTAVVIEDGRVAKPVA